MERINKRFVYFICLVSAMGGLLFGYDCVVIGGAKPFYELYYQIADSPSDQGLAMTIALIGCLIGAMLCGSLADRIGRKKHKMDYSAGVDISNYKNIKVPTSYMGVNSMYDFEGGYENDTQAGMLHVANHHVSPGKKQWTWGNGDFGQAWDRNPP